MIVWIVALIVLLYVALCEAAEAFLRRMDDLRRLEKEADDAPFRLRHAHLKRGRP